MRSPCYENQFSFILKLELTTITKISHWDSLWKRDWGELGSGLLVKICRGHGASRPSFFGGGLGRGVVRSLENKKLLSSHLKQHKFFSNLHSWLTNTNRESIVLSFKLAITLDFLVEEVQLNNSRRYKCSSHNTVLNTSACARTRTHSHTHNNNKH